MTAPGQLLAQIAASLHQAAIPYMVVGSFASSVHGVPRTTHDLDLVIDPSVAALETWLSGMDPDRFYVDADVARDALARHSMFNVIDIESGWKIDLIIRKPRAFSIEELARRKEVAMFGMLTPTATAEDTIIAKLEWAAAGESERQLRDVEGILRVCGDALDVPYIERWVTELGLFQWWRTVRGRV